MTPFLIELSLSASTVARAEGFDLPAAKPRDGHLRLREIHRSGGRTYFCHGMFFDGATADDLHAWLDAVPADDDLGPWLQKRDGDFWLAILDETGKVRLCVDRNGQLRVYSAVRGDKLFLSNSLVRLTEALPKPRLSNQGVFHLLNLNYSLDPWTLLDGVEASMPGTVTTFFPGKSTRVRYHEPVQPEMACFGTMDECVAGLDGAFRATFRKRWDASSEGTVLLSGGIDSVVMLRYLAEVSEKKVGAFTIGLTQEPDGDEVAAAKMAAKHFGIRHEVRCVDPTEVSAQFANALTLSDGPHYGNPWLLAIKAAAPDAFRDTQLYSGQDTRLHTPTFDLPRQLGILGSRLSPQGQRLLQQVMQLTALWPFRGKRTLAYWRRAGRPRPSLEAFFVDTLVGFKGNKSSPQYAVLRNELPDVSSRLSLDQFFKRYIQFDYRTQFTDDMNATVTSYEDSTNKVHFPFYDWEAVAACNRVPYRLGAKQILTRHSWSWIPLTQKAVLRHLLLRDVPVELVFRRKTTMPSIHLAFQGPLGDVVRFVLRRWRADLEAALEGDNRMRVAAIVAEYEALRTFRFPEEAEILWDAYCVSYLAIMHQLTAGNRQVLDEVRDFAATATRSADKVPA